MVSSRTTAAFTILCSFLWLVAACEYFGTSGSNADWSGTPILWVMLVVICPAVCFCGGMILVDGSLRKARGLSLLDHWALVAALMPVTLGSLLSAWAVRGLILMCR